MGETVKEILNTGIKEVELQSINQGSIKILGDFYRNCYPIDELKGMPGSKERYDRSFSCYNINRMKGSLNVIIDGNDEIKISQYNDNLTRNAVISAGTLMLEEISSKDYDSDINSTTKRLLLSQNGGEIITIKEYVGEQDDESMSTEFLYDETCKSLTYKSNTGTYVDSAESIEEAHDIVYGFFKKRINI